LWALAAAVASERVDLPNGLTVVTEADSLLPETVLHLELAHGAAEDPVAGPGLAHLVEHLLCTAVRFEDGLDGRLRSVGGSVRAWTTHEAITLEVAGPPEAAAWMGEALVAALRRPAVTPEELDRTRRVIARERDVTPVNDLRSALWAGHPYGRPVLGDPDGYTLAEVDAAIRRATGVAGAVLAVIGPDAGVPLGVAELEAGTPLVPPGIALVRRVHRGDELGWALPHLPSKETAAIEVAAELLAERWPTRLASGAWGTSLILTHVSEESAIYAYLRDTNRRLVSDAVAAAVRRIAAADRAGSVTAADRARVLAACALDATTCPDARAAARTELDVGGVRAALTLLGDT
jgi:hypothetical protein